MTDAEIEAIARLYCAKLGLDPDAIARKDVQTPRWKLMLHQAREAIAMQEAIAEVRATVTEGGV